MVDREYTEAILFARRAREDLQKAQRRYYAAMREALPVGTPIRFMAHNGRKYDGVITGPCRETGYVEVRNNATQRVYEIASYFIEGL